VCGRDFVRGDVADPAADGAYDLAFARLVLSHLADPLAARRAMRTAVRPGGVVAVEDLLTGTPRSEPACPVLDRLQAVYAATVRWHGGDPTIGPRLRALLLAAGLEDITEQSVTNPMGSVHEKLFVAELVHNMRPAIRPAGAATDREIDAIAADAESAARDPSTIFCQAQMYQVLGRRPGVEQDPG
jgi:SAM-dependent methyltransferase